VGSYRRDPTRHSFTDTAGDRIINRKVRCCRDEAHSLALICSLGDSHHSRARFQTGLFASLFLLVTLTHTHLLVCLLAPHACGKTSFTHLTHSRPLTHRLTSLTTTHPHTHNHFNHSQPPTHITHTHSQPLTPTHTHSHPLTPTPI
jgi:hypothetical protein